MNSELHDENKDKENHTIETKKTTEEQDPVTLNIFILFAWAIGPFWVVSRFLMLFLWFD